MADQHTGKSKHHGSCHCGAVRFEVDIDINTPASRCNCTICTKLNVTASIVKPNEFTLLTSEDALSQYVWGGQISVRYFCKHCGTLCFARGHLDVLGGDYVSVSMSTLDDIEVSELNVIYWDGRHNNWMAGPRPAPWPIAPAA